MVRTAPRQRRAKQDHFYRSKFSFEHTSRTPGNFSGSLATPLQAFLTEPGFFLCRMTVNCHFLRWNISDSARHLISPKAKR
jgi:hypothetical protein